MNPHQGSLAIEKVQNIIRRKYPARAPAEGKGPFGMESALGQASSLLNPPLQQWPEKSSKGGVKRKCQKRRVKKFPSLTRPNRRGKPSQTFRIRIAILTSDRSMFLFTTSTSGGGRTICTLTWRFPWGSGSV